MEKCSVCKEMTKGKYWCKTCKTVFVCPNPRSEAPNHRRDAKLCPSCGLMFEDYVASSKMYRECPKCKRKQGLSDPQCKFCRSGRRGQGADHPHPRAQSRGGGRQGAEGVIKALRK